MSLKRIPTDVENKISASNDIKSFTKAIEELVYNALDAKSTSIAVRLFTQEGSIQVIDNGCGILKKDFKFLGHRYYSSKLRSDSQAEFYGYRGSSLASIVEVSQKVKITSRHHDENTDCTFTKTFIESKEQDITETSTRPSKGTTVDVTGFLYKYHIQKSNINATNEISHIKTFLERISLVHCNTSISLRDDSTNEIVFQVNKHRDITQTLQTLYQISQQDIQELQVDKNEYKIHGFIEKANDSDNNYRFIFVNGRFIRNRKLQSSIDKRLKSNNCNRVTKRKRVFDDTEKVTKENCPFYFIFIKCPQRDYDIHQNDEETFIEFKNWDIVDKLIEKLIKFYKGDLKVKEIKNNGKKNGTEINEDTRKQVRKIIQKFLDNSAKRSKRLRLRTGVIGKNAKRKDIKKSEKLTISKIVSKQLGSRFNEFYRNNLPKDKNDLIASRLIPIENNKETYLQIRNKESEKREINNDLDSKQNKINTQNWETKPNNLSQDPLCKKFKNPTDTILKRCDMLLEGQKEYFVPNKAIDRIKYATSKTQYDVKYKNRCVTHKQALIKTSHDLIKTIFNCSGLFDLNFSKRAKDNKKEIVKNLVTKKYTVKKFCNQKLSSDNVEYLKESSRNKQKRFISERSCRNFDTSTMLRTVFHRNEKNKKDTSKNKFQHKAHVENFLHKHVCREQSIHTIETFESHIRNNVGINIKSLGDRSYISHKGHRFIHETLSSKVKKRNESEIITSNIENTTKNNFHKTYTLEIAESKDYYSQVYGKQWQKDNNYKNFSDVTFNNIFYKNDNLYLNTNPLTICESIFYNSTYANEDFRKNLYDNVSIERNKDLSPEYYNDNDGHIQRSVIEVSKGDFTDHNIRTNNININQTSKSYVEEQHKAISPRSICKTLFHDSTAENYVFRDNFCDSITIKSKEYIPKHNSYDDCIFHHSINDENNSLRFDNTKVRYNNNTNTNETSKVTLQEQLKTTNPVSIFESALQNSSLQKKSFEEYFYDNVSRRTIKDTKNFSSEGNVDYDKSFMNFMNKEHNRLLQNTIIKTVNINENSKEQQELIVTTFKKPPCGVNINWDCNISAEGFKLNSRHRFIPKGMSQITGIKNPKVPKFEKLDPNYFDTDIYDNFATNLQTISNVLEPGVQILTDLDIKGIRHVIKPSSNDPIFDDQSLKDAKVIGQVDNKFIGAKVTGRYARVNITSEFLVLFDQHAVDERIRLENNLSDYFDGDAWNSVSIDTMPINIPKDIITYLHNYKEQFTRFGLEWACNGDVVSIESIPKAVLGKHSRQINLIMKAVKSLILEEVEAIKSLKGNVSLYPKSIMDLVLSEACRYAIKFGDILRKSECEGLLSALSTCKLPFQCAHGRPVMAVMMELPTKSYEYKINMECVKIMKLKLAKCLN